MIRILIAVAIAAAAVAGLYTQDLWPFAKPEEIRTGSIASTATDAPPPPATKVVREEAAPAVTVVRAINARMTERVLITGTLVPRVEALIAPEVEGLRVTELLVEEGDRVTQGQVLARLEKETLNSSLTQIEAVLAKANAAITQANSNITAAEARRMEAGNAYDRARPLSKTGVLADSTLDQREAAARTAEAQLKVAQDGLRVAQAELAQVEAQRRDILWKLSRAEVRAPVGGIISRRNARMGAVASGTAFAQPMFNLIAEGEIELEAEVPENDLARLKPDQTALVTVVGAGDVKGRVRLVMPEIDKATRQGRVRISLEGNPEIRIGSFARGVAIVREMESLSLPASAVLFGTEGAFVQLVSGTRISTRQIKPGLQTADRVEIVSGLAHGDKVVAKSGTFLRDGDRITPIEIRSELAKTN